MAKGTSAISLKRGNGGQALVPALASGALDASAAAGPAPAKEGKEHARRQLAGAMLMGPIADRPIVHMVKPDYPEWAKREAVEASVTLRFVVRPDGRVRESVMVEKTAGFQDFDENARGAIRTWRFQALGAGESGDQWGIITFRYRLREAG
jgi:TonB family protein